MSKELIKPTPIAMVTGASRGIGAAIARRLAQAGFDIWLNYHSSHAEAQAVQQDIAAMGRACRLLPFDVSDEAAVEAALAPMLDQQTPYALVHNAGITRNTMAALMRRDEWDRVLDVNLTSFFLLVRPLLKAMLPQRRGRIVVISSLSGQTGQAGQLNYCAAKAGLIGAAKALAREVARRNILVNVVSPGLIDTDMIREVALENFLPTIPLGRVGHPEEVAGMVNFLLSEEAAYITGQVISINGGLYM